MATPSSAAKTATTLTSSSSVRPSVKKRKLTWSGAGRQDKSQTVWNKEFEERQERLQEVRLHKQDQQLKAQQDVPVRHRIMFLELYATDDDDDNACNWNSNRWLVYVCYASTTSNPPRGCLAGLTLEVAIQISITKTSWLLFSSFSSVHVVAILAQKETCFSHMAHQTSLTHQAYLGFGITERQITFSCFFLNWRSQ